MQRNERRAVQIRALNRCKDSILHWLIWWFYTFCGHGGNWRINWGEQRQSHARGPENKMLISVNVKLQLISPWRQASLLSLALSIYVRTRDTFLKRPLSTEGHLISQQLHSTQRLHRHRAAPSNLLHALHSWSQIKRHWMTLRRGFRGESTRDNRMNLNGSPMYGNKRRGRGQVFWMQLAKKRFNLQEVRASFSVTQPFL